MDGALVKLTIIPFETSKAFSGGPPAGSPFVAQFNPTEYTDAHEFELNTEETAAGGNGAPAKIKSVKPRTFTFDLMLDGSGVTPAGGSEPSSVQSVLDQIELFKATVGFDGDTHRPRYLQLVWGRLFVTCALETFSITYKLFDPAGMPIRATLSATFKEHRDEEVAALEDNRASPDIAHAHLVKGGEVLPNIVHTVYRDPGRYIAVARANGLDTVRALEPGATVRLPPVRSADAV